MTTSPEPNEHLAQTNEYSAVKTPDTQERFKAEASDLKAEREQWANALHESERLSEEDFSVRINAKD